MGSVLKIAFVQESLKFCVKTNGPITPVGLLNLRDRGINPKETAGGGGG